MYNQNPNWSAPVDRYTGGSDLRELIKGAGLNFFDVWYRDPSAPWAHQEAQDWWDQQERQETEGAMEPKEHRYVIIKS